MKATRFAILTGIGMGILVLSLAAARQDAPPPEHRTATATRYELIHPLGNVILVVHSDDDVASDTLVVRDGRGQRLGSASPEDMASIIRMPAEVTAINERLDSVRSSAQLTRQRTDDLDQRVRTLEQMGIDPADRRDAEAQIRQLERQLEMNERDMQRMRTDLDRNDRTIRDMEFRLRDLERRVPQASSEPAMDRDA